MFYEITEVQRIESNIKNIFDCKQKLEQMNLVSYSPNQKAIIFKLLETFKNLIQQNELILQTLRQIENQVQLDCFVPNQINIQDLVYDPTSLPEWFVYVFQKQYEKQKKNLDCFCKKSYKSYSLTQLKNNFQRQTQSFNLLIKRFQSLGEKDKKGLNIMGEAQMIKTKLKNIKEKFHMFCNTISCKILSFLQQTISKSMNFSKSINSIDYNMANLQNNILQSQKYEHNSRGYTNKFKQTTPSFENKRRFDPQKMLKTTDFYARSLKLKTVNELNKNYPNCRFNNTLSDFYN